MVQLFPINRVLLTCLAAWLFLTGCHAKAPAQRVLASTQVIVSTTKPATLMTRLVQPGDRIRITWSSEERAGREVRYRKVDEAGRISMPLINEVMVTRRTAKEVAGELKRRYAASDAQDGKYDVTFEDPSGSDAAYPADTSFFQLSERDEIRSQSTRKIQPGDRICIRVVVSSLTESSAYRKIVNDEGTVSMPYIGRLRAAGRNPGEFADDIEQAYAHSSADTFGAKFIVTVENED